MEALERHYQADVRNLSFDSNGLPSAGVRAPNVVRDTMGGRRRLLINGVMFFPGLAMCVWVKNDNGAYVPLQQGSGWKAISGQWGRVDLNRGRRGSSWSAHL